MLLGADGEQGATAMVVVVVVVAVAAGVEAGFSPLKNGLVVFTIGAGGCVRSRNRGTKDQICILLPICVP